MGRRSLKETRSEEILEAFERCVARHGVDGTSLEDIAEEAGMKRAIIRHYIGNRDEVVEEFGEHFVRKLGTATDALFDYLPASDRVETLIDWLFDPRYTTGAEQVVVFQALVAVSERFPRLRKKLSTWVTDFNGRLAQVLRQEFPARDPELCAVVANGIGAIYFNVDALAPLKLGKRFRADARQSAGLLIEALRGLH